jgi:hypothetical protein
MLRRHSLLNLRLVDPEDGPFNNNHATYSFGRALIHKRSEAVSVVRTLDLRRGRGSGAQDQIVSYVSIYTIGGFSRRVDGS